MLIIRIDSLPYGDTVSERGDLLELVCSAIDCLPALSATVRSWTNTARRRRAMEEVRGMGRGSVPMLMSGRGDPPAETEHRQRVVIARGGHAFRIIQDSSGLVLGSDGTSTWIETAPGEAMRQPHHGLPTPAAVLLEPSWLATYKWDPPTRDAHHGRDVCRLQANPRPGLTGWRVPAGPLPSQVEVVIDAELGFLHRMTGLLHDQPYHLVELLELDLDPVVSDDTFRLDESEVRVFEPEDGIAGTVRRWEAGSGVRSSGDSGGVCTHGDWRPLSM